MATNYSYGLDDFFTPVHDSDLPGYDDDPWQSDDDFGDDDFGYDSDYQDSADDFGDMSQGYESDNPDSADYGLPSDFGDPTAPAGDILVLDTFQINASDSPDDPWANGVPFDMSAFVPPAGGAADSGGGSGEESAPPVDETATVVLDPVVIRATDSPDDPWAHGAPLDPTAFNASGGGDDSSSVAPPVKDPPQNPPTAPIKPAPRPKPPARQRNRPVIDPNFQTGWKLMTPDEWARGVRDNQTRPNFQTPPPPARIPAPPTIPRAPAIPTDPFSQLPVIPKKLPVPAIVAGSAKPAGTNWGLLLMIGAAAWAVSS